MSDEDLKRRFQALRESERSSAPAYARPTPKPRPRTLGWRWPSLLAGAVAASVAVGLVLAPPTPTPEPDLTPERTSAWQPGSWAMPTDVLLELPGQELLTEVPHFGSPLLDLEPTTQAPPALQRSPRRTPA